MLWASRRCRWFGPDDNFVDKSVNDVDIFAPLVAV